MGVVRGANSVGVVGLDDLRKELKKLDDKTLTDELKATNYAVASLVVRQAKTVASSVGRQAVKAAGTLKASKTAARAQVTLGNKNVPWASGAEFGAIHKQIRLLKTGRKMVGWNQFKGWKGNRNDAGYFLHPAIRELSSEIVEMYGDALEKIASAAFPD